MRRLATRLALRQLAEQVPDPELRAKLTPRYELGCKRILPTDEWYPALDAAERRAGHRRHPRDPPALDRRGRRHRARGRHDHLRHRLPRDRHPDRASRSAGATGARWRRPGTARRAPTRAPPWPASRTCSSWSGPNTGLGHNSIVFMIESQINYVAGALQRDAPPRRRRRSRSGPRRRPPTTTEIDRMTEGTVWVSGGCSSYYIDAHGRNSTIWPTFTWPFRQRTREFDAVAYAARRAGRRTRAGDRVAAQGVLEPRRPARLQPGDRAGPVGAVAPPCRG